MQHRYAHGAQRGRVLKGRSMPKGKPKPRNKGFSNSRRERVRKSGSLGRR